MNRGCYMYRKLMKRYTLIYLSPEIFRNKHKKNAPKPRHFYNL